jgi:ATP-binding cassette, subfamily F, member 3
MLSAHSISKTYGIQTVLQDITFSLNAGERVGLIGPNGCGKTTLMRILAGRETPDSGRVVHASSGPSTRSGQGLRIGYLSQGFELDPTLTLEDAITSTSRLEAEVVELAAALSADPSNRTLQTDYDEAVDKLARSANLQPASVLTSLGLADIPLDTKVGTLSGGQKTRLLLARLLLDEPQLLLLDEPTNHLDIAMLEWLEGWLGRFPGGALIVSHDRVFLDRTVSAILELDPRTHGLKLYGGNYSDYMDRKEAEREQQLQTYLDQQAEIRRMRADISRTKQQAAFTERQASSIRIGGSDFKIKGYKSYQQGIAKKVAAKAKSRERKLERFLDSDELVERPQSDWQIKLSFEAPGHLSRDVLVTEGLAVGYPGCPPLLENLRLQVRGGQRVALTGSNGCGKTTLLRTIAGKLDPLAGSVRLGGSVKLGFMTQEQEQLDPAKTPLEIVQAAAGWTQTATRTFLHAFLFGGDLPLRPSGSLSYGERARLALALLIAQGCTFLLLDEPINHLDIPSRTRFEQALNQYQGTVLAVVHDRYFVEHFATEIWCIENGLCRIKT